MRPGFDKEISTKKTTWKTWASITYILKEYDKRVWSGCILLRIWIYGRPL
jgi:hypothetical protein